MRITKVNDNGFVTFGDKPYMYCKDPYCEMALSCHRVKKRTCPYLQLMDKLAKYEDICEFPEVLKEVYDLIKHVPIPAVKEFAERYK